MRFSVFWEVVSYIVTYHGFVTVCLQYFVPEQRDTVKEALLFLVQPYRTRYH